MDSSGNILARYVRGDAADEIVTGYTSFDPTARAWYHLDQRKSVIAVTDPSGVATVVNRYDEYGQPQGGNYGTFQYTGQMWLGEIGVYNYKARMYWPNERPGGRFMQTDPVGPVDSPNLYQYALNDPVNLTDPLGLGQLGDVFKTLRVNPNECGGSCAEIDVLGSRLSGGAGLLLATINGTTSATGTLGRGGGTGNPIHRSKPQNKSIPCSAALNEPGAVVAVAIGFTFTPGIGPTGSFGTWTNIRTGTHGNFTSIGGQVGLEIGGSAGPLLYTSLNSFNAWNVNAHGSIPFLSGSISVATNGSLVGVGVSPGPSVGAGAGVSATKISLSQCQTR